MVFADDTGLARRIADPNPDIVLIDVANPSRDMLKELTFATAPLERPVAILWTKTLGT